MSTTAIALLGLIAKTPMMRAVQIADRLDITVDAAEAALRDALVAGHLIEHEVDAPNGRKAMAYELSAQYMASAAFKSVPPSLEVKVEKKAAPAPVAAVSRPAATVTQKAAASTRMTKVERAIAYVHKNGPSSSTQLHAALALGEGVHVSSYLGSAVRTGRLARDGQRWSIPEPASVPPGNIPKFSHINSAPAPVELNETNQPPAPAGSLPRAASNGESFRCALWSDGTFEIQRDGATVATLHPHEHNTVIETLQRARAA